MLREYGHASLLRFFAVITYITDYYLKDETGTLKFIQEALAGIENEQIKAKMNTVKNTFITKHQTGESEIYYKMLPFLHLSQSNIGTEFVPTGFRRNRSRFLKQITSDLANRMARDKVIEVEGKEGRNYVEKENIIDKYLRKPVCLYIFLAQFAKRFELLSKKPKNSTKQFMLTQGI